MPKLPTGVTAARAENLWYEKYADQIYLVDGREVNRQQIEHAYFAELESLDPEDVRPEPAPPGAARRAFEAEKDKALQAQLDRALSEINFEGAGLAEVIDFLRDVSRANIFVDWGALENAGIARDQPVTVRLRNVGFGHALEMILHSAGDGKVALDYTVDRGVIKISTAERIDALTDIRAYDVRDIVPAEMERDELVLLIQEAVAPNAWGFQGSGSAIRASKHKLIVSTNRANHRQIEDILSLLREEPASAQSDGDGATARGRGRR